MLEPSHHGCYAPAASQCQDQRKRVLPRSLSVPHQARSETFRRGEQ
jgi:hypothetical protein